MELSVLFVLSILRGHGKQGMKRLLVVAAHPDDEVLGCGATVVLRRQQGWEAHLVIMTQGVLGREKTGAADPKLQAEIEKLQSEMHGAADVLGFETVNCLGFPDNRMDTVSRMDVSHAIRQHLARLRPQAIYTHHPGDYNWDHTATFEAVLMAARHSPGEFGPEEIVAFEVLSSTERGYPNGGHTFRPNMYVDVAKTIDKKKLALCYYASELRRYPHPRSLEGIEYLARKRGSEIGIEYAEAFELIRRVEMQ
jgi:LmbE family N-acetylglucosaminyl deacetylase